MKKPVSKKMRLLQVVAVGIVGAAILSAVDIDGHGGPLHTETMNAGYVYCDERAELDRFFDHLGAGDRTGMDAQIDSGRCGIVGTGWAYEFDQRGVMISSVNAEVRPGDRRTIWVPSEALLSAYAD